MSQGNVEIARKALDAWQRDDLEAWASLMHPDLEWLPAVERELGRVVYHGHDVARELWNSWRTEFEDFWADTDEIRDVGDGRVVHLLQMRFRGTSSGITVGSPLALVITVSDGKIVRSMDYLSHDDALKAVGLEE